MCRLLHCRLHLCRIAVSTIRAYTVPHCCTMYILIVALVLSHDIQIVACPALMKTMTHILSLLAVTLQNPIQIPVWVSYWKDNKRARNGNVSHRISNDKNKNNKNSEFLWGIKIKNYCLIRLTFWPNVTGKIRFNKNDFLNYLQITKQATFGKTLLGCLSVIFLNFCRLATVIFIACLCVIIPSCCGTRRCSWAARGCPWRGRWCSSCCPRPGRSPPRPQSPCRAQPPSGRCSATSPGSGSPGTRTDQHPPSGDKGYTVLEVV